MRGAWYCVGILLPLPPPALYPMEKTLGKVKHVVRLFVARFYVPW